MPVTIIGIMSGSSLDGLDMALCKMDETHGVLQWDLIAFQTVPFPEEIFVALKGSSMLSGFELMQLDADFGKFIGREIKKWMDQHGLHADYIASHGHTVFHEPRLGFTTQIGNGAHIAHETGIDTITSFRSADVAAGGQGAPFAPVADRVLFPGHEGYLNLGGIANVNLVTDDGIWKAWDIGPCNQALNFLAAKLGMSYDEDGKIASSGNEIGEVIDDLLAMFPFRNGQPKGLSNAEVQETWIQYLDSSSENVVDLITSTTEAIIRMVMNQLCPLLKEGSKILVTGGGTHNRQLIWSIESIANDFNLSVQIPSNEIIDYKECLLMAYLGLLTMQNKSYGIYPVTGASSDTIGGALYKAFR